MFWLLHSMEPDVSGNYLILEIAKQNWDVVSQRILNGGKYDLYI